MRLALVCLLLLTGVASADVHKSKAGKVSIDIPKKWQVDAKDELIRAASPNGEVALFLWVVDSPDVKAALTKLEGELYSAVNGLKWVDRTRKLKINRVRGTWVEGVGVSSRQTQLDLIVFVGKPPSKRGVILLAVVDHDKYDTNRSAIQSIFGSLRPTK